MFGISKQAYYKRISTLKEKQMKNEVVLQKVAEIRQTMPHTGTVKLWEHLRLYCQLLTLNWEEMD